MTSILCDLDGVVYRGEREISGAGAAIRRLVSSEAVIHYITNNSTRTPAEAASKISRVTGVETSPDQVLTSAMAAGSMLNPTDSPVLVVGEDGIRHAVASAGGAITEDPHQARAVVVGLDRGFDYEVMARAMAAIRLGARFIATNDDDTYPTEEDLLPGSGAIVAAISRAAGRQPEIAGKPHQPMLDLIKSRVEGEVWVFGDRADTDIALAEAESDWTSVLVLTGVTPSDSADLARADHVVADISAAVDLVLEARNRQ